MQFLPGVHRPMILNLQKPAVRQAITNPDSCYWLRPSNEIRDLAPAAPGARSDAQTMLAGDPADAVQPLGT